MSYPGYDAASAGRFHFPAKSAGKSSLLAVTAGPGAPSKPGFTPPGDSPKVRAHD